MTLNKTIQDALNEHMNQEFYASYLYLSMSAYCEEINLPGFAHWMRVQSQEEYSHAMKMFDFIVKQKGRVILHPIDQPTIEFHSPLDVMQQTLEHERYVSRLINQLYELAVREHDYPTQVHLQWFITEQVGEEKVASNIVEQLKMIGERGDALLLLDRELAKRGSEMANGSMSLIAEPSL
jgi:ferritin